MMSHLLCIFALAVVFVAAKEICKPDYSVECDDAVKEAQRIINSKFNKHDKIKKKG